jgi:electron transfer flavoprotein alpha subunit
VIAEHHNLNLLDSTIEVLGEGRALANHLRVPLHAVVLGDSLQPLLAQLSKQDVDVIDQVQHPLLQQYLTETYISALLGLWANDPASPILLNATSQGKDLAPRLAAELHASLATDCIWVKLGSKGDLNITQPIQQDRLHATWSFPPETAVVISLRPGAMGGTTPTQSRTPRVILFEPQLQSGQIGARILETIPGDPAKINLTEAEVIVAGGRGVKDPQAWHLIQELTEVLGASVGGSRVAMDLGYIKRQQMIGQTGTRIHPRLYIGAGISGVPHHLDGVKADTLVAINLDRNAPFVKRSTLAAVYDLHQFIPALIDRIRQAKLTKKG